jgi:hypothetical protein
MDSQTPVVSVTAPVANLPSVADVSIPWVAREWRADGTLRYVFGSIERAVAFTLAMNTYKAARARMLWRVDVNSPCEVLAVLLSH